MRKLSFSIVAALSALPAAATVATAQPLPPGATVPPGSFAIINRNNTGGDVSITIPRGPTGADTYTSNSAAGGNAGRPELAVPNGSAGGGSGGDSH